MPRDYIISRQDWTNETIPTVKPGTIYNNTFNLMQNTYDFNMITYQGIFNGMLRVEGLIFTDPIAGVIYDFLNNRWLEIISTNPDVNQFTSRIAYYNGIHIPVYLYQIRPVTYPTHLKLREGGESYDSYITPEQYAMAMELQLPGGTILRLVTTPTDLSAYIDGVLQPSPFIGCGALLTISPMRESGDIASQGVQITLANIPLVNNENLINTINNIQWQGRTIKIYLVKMLAGFGWGEFVCMGTYLFDKCPITMRGGENGASLTITAMGENKLTLWNKPNPRQCTQPAHNIIYGADSPTLKFINQQPGQFVKWGAL